jgi:spore coat protein U-like protein
MIRNYLPKIAFLGLFLLPQDQSAIAALVCTATMTDINFGNVTVINNQNVDITGTVSINCTGAAANEQLRLCLHLCEGSGGMDNADINPRYMNSASGLQYNIFRDGAFTQIWGARGTAGQTYCSNATWNIWNLVHASSPFADASGNFSTTITAYGRVFSGQTAMPAGSYSSSFTSTGDSTSRFALAYRNCCSACNNTGSGFIVTSAPFTVSANVVPGCTVTASDLNFGTASLLTSNVDATNSVSATCTSGLSYAIGLSQGTTAGGTTTTRLMKHPSTASTVPYTMFSDAARTANWGNSGTDDVNGTGTGSAVNHTVYGRVPSQAIAPEAGGYSDTVTVTITY